MSKQDHLSLRHIAVVVTGLVSELTLAFVTSSLLLNQLLICAAILLLIGSMLRLSDHRRASNALWITSFLTLSASLLYMTADWLFFHMRVSLIGAVSTGLLIGLALIINGKGLIRLPD